MKGSASVRVKSIPSALALERVVGFAATERAVAQSDDNTALHHTGQQADGLVVGGIIAPGRRLDQQRLVEAGKIGQGPRREHRLDFVQQGGQSLAKLPAGSGITS